MTIIFFVGHGVTSKSIYMEYKNDKYQWMERKI